MVVGYVLIDPTGKESEIWWTAKWGAPAESPQPEWHHHPVCIRQNVRLVNRALTKIKRRYSKEGLDSIAETWGDLFKDLIQSEKDRGKAKTGPRQGPSKPTSKYHEGDPLWEPVTCEGCGSTLRRALYQSRGHGPQCDRRERYAANHLANRAKYRENNKLKR